MGLQDVKKFIEKNNCFLVVGHYDADGLSSTAIACLMLERLNKKYSFIILKSLEPNELDKIKEKNETLLFVDLGSSSISRIEEKLKGKEIAIIDHHQPEKQTTIPHYNAHLEGFDGSTEISGAGMVYLLARSFGNNKDLAKLAIIGAVGDQQDKEGRLIGKNRELLKEAEEAGEVIVKKDIRMYGRHSRPLIQFLSYSTDPFLPGLTANEEACAGFLKKIGINLVNEKKEWRYYCDLTEDEKKRLVTAIYIYAKEHGAPEFLLKGLIGEVYELVKEPDKTPLKDAKEFSTILNACGRHEAGELGVRVLMGDRGEALRKAEKLLQKHRKMLRDGIEFVQKQGVKEKENIYYFNAGLNIKDSIVGTIAGMLYGTREIKQDKPIITLAVKEDGTIKISARGTKRLVSKGLDLGKALKEITSCFEGAGGGHDIAAGATIPANKVKEFLEELNKKIGEQLKNA